MSDLSKRILERRAIEGAPEDRAQLLAARMRSEPSELRVECDACEGRGGKSLGTRSMRRKVCAKCESTGSLKFSWKRRLALMVYCGDEAAQTLRPRACGLCSPYVPDRACATTRCWCCKGPVSLEGYCGKCRSLQPGELYPPVKCGRHERGCKNCPPKTLDAFLTGLVRWPDALLHAVAASCELVLSSRDHWRRHGTLSGYACDDTCEERHVELAVESVRAYAECPCNDHAATLLANLPSESTTYGIRYTHDWIGLPFDPPSTRVTRINAAVSEVGVPSIRKAICKELISWALR